MSAVPYSYTTGRPVLPAAFRGRAEACRLIVDRLSSRQMKPFRVVGLRRSGKTSLFHYLAAHAEDLLGPGTLVIFLNAELFRGPDDFWVTLAHEIGRRVDAIPPTSFPRSLQFTTWLEQAAPGKRIVVLLDEFDLYRRNPAFDESFFQETRAMMALQGGVQLVWVTASWPPEFIASSDVTPRDAAQLYFFNNFDASPIYTGSLTPAEARDLVQRPSEGQVDWTEAAVTEVLRIAGGLPYSLQVVADRWLQEAPSKGRSKRVIERLLQEGSQVQLNLRTNWDHLRDEEREVLRAIQAGKSVDPAVAANLERLGLARDDGDGWQLEGALLTRWVARRVTRGGGPSGHKGPTSYDKQSLKNLVEDHAEAWRVLEKLVDVTGFSPAPSVDRDVFENAPPAHRMAEIWLAERCFREHAKLLLELREQALGAWSNADLSRYREHFRVTRLVEASGIHREALLQSQVYAYLKVLLPPAFGAVDAPATKGYELQPAHLAGEKEELQNLVLQSKVPDEVKEWLLTRIAAGMTRAEVLQEIESAQKLSAKA